MSDEKKPDLIDDYFKNKKEKGPDKAMEALQDDPAWPWNPDGTKKRKPEGQQ